MLFEEEVVESVDVTFEVLDVDHVRRGDVMAFAVVRIEVAGVAFVLQGVQVRRHAEGFVVVEPQFRDPRSAQWFPAVCLPDEVWQAVALEVAEVASGKKVKEIVHLAA